ncbi:hypothetical protein Goarm_009455, partial [Gossypium armourianum]|nr:hypothetical protein [Gossypium armourianum]
VEAKKQTFNSFDDLLANSDKPVLVDFYATWCGPCQFMVPVLNEVSATLKDKIQVVKIDTEKYPSIADKYNIQGLPTFIIFKDGKPLDRFATLSQPLELMFIAWDRRFILCNLCEISSPSVGYLKTERPPFTSAAHDLIFISAAQGFNVNKILDWGTETGDELTM